MSLRKSALASAIALSVTAVQAEQETLQLEEVLVTAQKVESTLQDTPISMAAFSGEDIARHGIQDLGDITAKTPNVDITPFPNSRSSLVVFMRGVGNNDSQTTQDPAVGVYVDGVYVGRSVGLTNEVANLERVEVLRGPQGTLYGRNTTGGAINLITAKPEQERSATVLLSAQNDGNYRGLVNFQTGENDGVAASLSYARSAKDGWVKNDGEGKDFGEQDVRALRFALSADLNDKLSLNYSYDDGEERGPQHFYQFTQFPGPVDVSDRQESGSWHQSAEDSITEVRGHTLNLELETEAGLLRSITGVRKLEEHIVQDYGAGADAFDVVVNIEQEQTSQEFQWLADINDSARYILGLYYFEEEGFEDEQDFAAGGLIEDRQIRSENKATAVYGQLSLDASEKLEIIVGARYTRDEREATKTSSSFTTSPDNTLSDDDSWSNGTGDITFDYTINDDANVYAKVQTGYKSGGYNVRSTEAGFAAGPFDEENMISKEIGFKTSWFDRRLQVNGAVFDAEYRDMQVQQITDPAFIFLTDVFNAGEAEISGLELDITALLAEGLVATVSYGYTDAEFVELIDNSPISPTFGENIADQYVMPYAPEHTYTVGLEYRSDIDLGELVATLDYSWRDERYGTASNPDQEGFFLDDYGLLDGRVAISNIDAGEGRVAEVALWAKNIANEEYLVHQISLDGAGTHSGYYGEERSFGVDISVRFE